MELSIIIPAFNAQNTIVKTLNSIISQSNESISYEIIIIDDGSEDNTYQVCQNFIDNTGIDNIKLLTQSNEGVSSARNVGISQAIGNKVFFLDSDDEITSDFFKSIKNIINKPFILFDFFCVKKDVIQKEFRFDISGEISIQELFIKVRDLSLINPMCAKIFDLSIVKENNILFDINERFGEDTLFLYNYISYVDKVYIVNKFLYKINLDNNHSLSRKYYDLFCISLKLLLAINQMELTTEVKANLNIKIIKNYMIHAVKIGKSIYEIKNDLFNLRKVVCRDGGALYILNSNLYDKLLNLFFMSRRYFIVYIIVRFRMLFLL